MAISANTRKNLFGLTALSAWVGFGLSLVIEIFYLVPYKNEISSLYGTQPAGWPGAFGRVIDLLSYFTIWSQLVVGLVMGLLFLNPLRDSPRLRVFFVDAVLMISVTGIVYNLMIGPKFPPKGLNVYSSFLEHTFTPILVIVVFLLVGPRGWFSKTTVRQALYLPIAYIFYALIRGAIVNQYPYDFIDVVQYGYLAVIITVLVILSAALVMLLLYWAIDSRLTKSSVKDLSHS